MSNMKSWAFKRPYCSPGGGLVVANSPADALNLVHYAYGSCSNTTVYCAETDEQATSGGFKSAVEMKKHRVAPYEVQE